MKRGQMYIRAVVFFAMLAAVSPAAGATFVRGDTNLDGQFNLGDPICTLNYLFGPPEDPSKRTVALCLDASDINDDGRVNVADPVRLLMFMFADGSPPPAPYPDAGEDPTPDDLDCIGLNPQAYDISVFKYEDTKPESFQPMSRRTTTLAEKADWAAIAPAGSWWADSDTLPEPATGIPLSAGEGVTSVLSLAAGQIDDDPEQEIVALVVRRAWYELFGSPFEALGLSLVAIESTSTHVLADLGPLCPVTETNVVVNGSIALGNVDDDDYDEIAVGVSFPATTCSGSGGGPDVVTLVDVYDDPDEDLAPLFHCERNRGTPSHCWIACGDVDMDGYDEVAFIVSKDSRPSENVISVVDGFMEGAPMAIAAGPFAIKDGVPNLSSQCAYPSRCFDGRVLVGNFSPDGGDEICLARAGHFVSGCGRVSILLPWYCETFEFQVRLFGMTDGGLNDISAPQMKIDPYNGSCVLGYNFEGDIEVEKADLDGDGLHELVVFCTGHHWCTGAAGAYLTTAAVMKLDGAAEWAPGPSLESTGAYFFGGAATWIKLVEGSGAGPAATLVSGDIDADGRDEVFIQYGGQGFIQCIEAAETGGKWGLRFYGGKQQIARPGGAAKAGARSVVGDFDGDDLMLRYTGNKELSLGDPLPLVLMAPPPWKDGISQNVGLTRSTYEHGEGSSEAVSVSLGAAITGWAGFQTQIPEIAGVTVKAKIGGELKVTRTDASITGYAQGFTSGYDDECIVFQGTLYESYAYELIAPPEAVAEAAGRPLWLDIPVATTSFMWSVEKYNGMVPESRRIDPSILGITMGAPGTYMTNGAASELVKDYVGWMTPGSMEVCQGGLAGSQKIRLVEEHATQEARSWSISVETELKVGPVLGGVSIGATGADIFRSSVSEEMVYTGSVGCIEDAAEQARWSYTWGVVVYNRGVRSTFRTNGENEPSGVIDEGVRPFQILTYWANPTGPGYGK
ncbi:MAG: hypothetical protein JXP34_04425 [Planctomycetes bacterium]|nr:hypothetical protein [Planctomycetota bacterium]